MFWLGIAIGFVSGVVSTFWMTYLLKSRKEDDKAHEVPGIIIPGPDDLLKEPPALPSEEPKGG